MLELADARVDRLGRRLRTGESQTSHGSGERDAGADAGEYEHRIVQGRGCSPAGCAA
jgi:hypothetical protein